MTTDTPLYLRCPGGLRILAAVALLALAAPALAADGWGDENWGTMIWGGPAALCGNATIDAGEECDGGADCTDCACDPGFESTDPVSFNCQQVVPVEFERFSID